MDLIGVALSALITLVFLIGALTYAGARQFRMAAYCVVGAVLFWIVVYTG